MIIKMIAFGVFSTPFFSDMKWVILYLGTEETERVEKECEEVVVHMKSRDDDRILYDIQDNVIHKIIESYDGFRVIQFTKTERMRMVFYQGEFQTAFILLTDEDRIPSWVQWKYGKELRRPDVVAVCKSYSLTNFNYNSYMSSNWDRMDCFVVIISVVGLGMPDLQIFKALRAIRPLRIAVRIEQVKVVVSSLMRAIPGMINTMIFCLMFWFVLAILGVNFFSGQLWACSCDEELDPNSDEYIACEEALESVEGKGDCTGEHMSWDNTRYNFDHVFSAVHSLFVISTLSGWSDIMFECVNSAGVDLQPIPYNRGAMAIYFAFCVCVCAFFSLNLIISVVVDNFNRIKDEKNGSAFLTQKQLLWVKSKRLSSRITLEREPSRPAGNWRERAFDIVRSYWFEHFIMTCIIANTATMSMEHYDQTAGWTSFLGATDSFFVSIFVLEAVFKLSAFGWTDYFYDNWNKFDFFIVIVGIISLFPDIVTGLTVLRLLRIGRVLRLINKAKTLQTLFLTLVYSIPSLWNIGVLLFVIFFIYAIVGMNLFGKHGCNFMKDGETAEQEEEDCENDFDKVFWRFQGDLHS